MRMVRGSPPKRTMAPGAPTALGTLSTKPTATAMADAIAGERAVNADVHERIAIGNERADLDDGSGGAAESGSGNDEGKRGKDAVRPAGEVVAELVDKQNAQQSEGIGETGHEELRMAMEPDPRPQIAVTRDGRHATNKVVHEACAVGGRRDKARHEQQRCKNILAKT